MNAKEKLNYLMELNRSDKNRFDFEIYTVCGDKNKKLWSWLGVPCKEKTRVITVH